MDFAQIVFSCYFITCLSLFFLSFHIIYLISIYFVLQNDTRTRSSLYLVRISNTGVLETFYNSTQQISQNSRSLQELLRRLLLSFYCFGLFVVLSCKMSVKPQYLICVLNKAMISYVCHFLVQK